MPPVLIRGELSTDAETAAEAETDENDGAQQTPEAKEVHQTVAIVLGTFCYGDVSVDSQHPHTS